MKSRFSLPGWLGSVKNNNNVIRSVTSSYCKQTQLKTLLPIFPSCGIYNYNGKKQPRKIDRYTLTKYV